jgi:aspartyl/glutamyl-tRNA(Asn/Gln) amidotransferase C subunit
MSKFTKEVVDSLADKLLIGLTEEENKMVLSEFDKIDSDINLINEIDGIDSITPMSWCLDDFSCELREDVACESSSIEDLMSNCDDYRVCEVKIPKVVE